MGDSTAIITFEDIFFRCVNNPDGGEPNPKECSFFLPQDEADSLVVEDKVAATLVKLLEMSAEDAEKLADYVVKSAKKVFLTLLYTDTIEFINDLQTAGFNDEHLPVCYTQNPSGAPTGHEVCSLRPELPSTSRVPLEGFANWGLRKIAEFGQKQWIFLCPVFDDTEFIYQFSKEQRLPFMPAVNHGEGAGHFGLVQRLKLHPAHYRTGSSSIRSTDCDGDGPIEVALKYLLQDGRPAEREKFYKREMETLQMMNKLNNRHLIKAIATYKKGSQMYFLFPWADGGNLEDLFHKGQGKLDETQANWAFAQMIGLSAGISELNSSKFRHGDIKPSNILCFGIGAGTSNDCRLVIADVGLAKFHAEYTRNRNKSTTTRHGSMTYEPPEVLPKTGSAILSTKRYDTWSLGCVFLEFLIWLLYGGNGLKAFYEDLNKDPNNCRFWKDSFWLGQRRRHPAVSRWIKRLQADLRHPSAFRDLVATIKKSMLVRIEGRKSSKDLHQELLKIQDKVSDDPKYLYSSDLERLASRRAPASGTTVDQGVIKNLAIQYVSNQRAKSQSFLQRLLTKARSGLGEFKLSSGKPVSYVLDEASHVFRNVFDDRALISIYSDPASGFAPPYAQVGLPILPNAGSPQQFKLLNAWIKRCDESHNCLPHKEGTDERVLMPTRVIKVGLRRLRLVETSNGISGKYVALSHCWGRLTKEQKFCTYQSNIEALKKDIPYKSLPKSFQDAVRVTRALRVPYLWIDSICIIQEDEEDWKSEASKMEQVFSSAYCTIAASSATSSLDGFLGKRKPRACVSIRTSHGPLYLAEAIDDFHEHVEKSVLSTRGWVLQERALSRRTIYFTSTQVYWECGEGIFCETLATLQNPHSRFIGDAHFPASGLEFYKDGRIRLIQHLYEVYSKLQLTNAGDRPKAILGLQNRLAYTFGSRADYGVHWNYPERTLLWRAESPGKLCRISFQTQDAVPSWSWMAYTGAITYVDIPFKEVDWMGNPQIPFGPGDQNGEWNGLLCAQARPLRIDNDQLRERMVLDSGDSMFCSKGWKCVVVGKSKTRTKNDAFLHYVLLVRPLSGAAETYERVGVASLLTDHISAETEVVFLA